MKIKIKPWKVKEPAHYCGEYIFFEFPTDKFLEKYIVKKVYIYYEMDFYVGYFSKGYNTQSFDLHKKYNFIVHAIKNNKITLRFTDRLYFEKEYYNCKFVIKYTSKNERKGLLFDDNFYARLKED